MHFFESARFASALTLTIVGTAFATHALTRTVGWAGLIGILSALVVLAVASFLARWESIEWHGLLPISLLVFVGWCALSVFWSDYQWTTVASVLYQVAFAFLGVYIALVRDTIQIVRSVGDVLRVLLGVSLALEVLSGLLIDLPIRFLGILGDLDSGGPIQGIFGTRNQLGLVSLIALVTFLVEWRTRSVLRIVAIPSVAGAALCLLLTRSPVSIASLVIVGVATLALYLLRRAPAEHRRYWQLGLLGAAFVVAVVTVLARTRIVSLLNAGSEFEVRYELWMRMTDTAALNPLEGWGWAGLWRRNVPPFVGIDFSTGRSHATGLNGFLDVYLQLGLVGLLLFLVLVLLAFGRSWLLASNKRSAVYVWPALVLVGLLVTSLGESSILVDAGWLLLVVCTVKAAQGMSWRLRYAAGR
ncbi:O-antigen ligase [Compostimonas suwonensis]|uniref:O-antigen ligase n=2 Tax=Compostimonas suwonensis TaxID=1048394 RepID=A0A2M9BUT8_9MICO|nr:O-antigen ligase [Compostimonas suwonensis]